MSAFSSPPEVRSPYLTLPEAAGYLWLSLSTLRRYVKAGTLPARKLPHHNRRYLVDRAVVEDMAREVSSC